MQDTETTRNTETINKIMERMNLPQPAGADTAEFQSRAMEKLQEWNTLMSYYRCAIYEIETKFNVLNEQFSLQYDSNPIETIKSRLKSIDSIVEKMNRRNIAFSAENVEKELNDVAGVRVICSFIEDIYMLEKCLEQQDDVRIIQRKDYIAHPKENGYRSLHLIVEVPIFLKNEKRYMKAEIQFRTIAMDFWATLEHKLRYKKNLDPVLLEDLSHELFDCAEKSAGLDRRMEWIKNQIDNYISAENEWKA